MEIFLDLTKYLEGVVGKALTTHKQGLALTVPYILSEEFPELNILYLKGNTVCLEDASNVKWKVCCSASNTFDVAPSFTKGYARSKAGVSPKDYLIQEGFTGLIFINFNSVANCSVTFKYIKDCDISSKGVVSIE